MRPSPAPIVAAWIAGRDAEEMRLTAVSEAGLLNGGAIMPPSRTSVTASTCTFR